MCRSSQPREPVCLLGLLHYNSDFKNGRSFCETVTVAWQLRDVPPGGGGFACVPGKKFIGVYTSPVDWPVKLARFLILVYPLAQALTKLSESVDSISLTFMLDDQLSDS